MQTTGVCDRGVPRVRRCARARTAARRQPAHRTSAGRGGSAAERADQDVPRLGPHSGPERARRICAAGDGQHQHLPVAPAQAGGVSLRRAARRSPAGAKPACDMHELRWSRRCERLPDRMRAAIVLRYYEDMTEPEIARTLGISVGTVKSTVSRAMAKLRSELGIPRCTAPAVAQGRTTSRILRRVARNDSSSAAVEQAGQACRRCPRGAVAAPPRACPARRR